MVAAGHCPPHSHGVHDTRSEPSCTVTSASAGGIGSSVATNAPTHARHEARVTGDTARVLEGELREHYFLL